MTLDPKATFNAPRLDGSLDILQIIEHNGRHSAQHPLFRFAEANGAIQAITWGSAAKAFDVAARFVLDSAAFKAADVAGAPPVVGILANLDSITYYALIVGIMRAGFTAFPISTRNSADGVAHLLGKTNCRLLLTSDDNAVARLAEASCSILQAENKDSHIPRVIVPSFDYFYNTSTNNKSQAVPTRVILDQATTPCVIMHSSGTISFPKPITLTYQMFFEHGTKVGREGNFSGHIISSHATPMYHLMGIKVIAYTALLGITLGVFRPSTPPIIPTPEAVLNAAVATSSSRIFCTPSFLESWAKQKSSVDALKTFSAIMWGGGPLQINVGDYLVKEGVTLVIILGMTEVGAVTLFFPKRIHSEGWEWFEFDPHFDYKFIREEGAEEIYKFIVKQNAFRTPAVVNTTVDGVPAYDTGDLFIRHPINPQLWKIYGRADEQIMHSSGEKTNPVPIEASLNNSPYISGAVMFGRARFQPGILITPSPDYKFDITDAEKTKKYINFIWDTVEEVNRQSPQHSRIFKEMILIANPDKEFEYTSKGSLRREMTLKKYEQEIERLYDAPESGSSDEDVIDLPQAKVPELGHFLPQIRTAVHAILGDSVGDDDDLFRAGADSLCAVSIRNAIVRDLHSSQALSRPTIDTIPADLLYYLPSISKISGFLYGAAHATTTVTPSTQTGVGAEMEGDDDSAKVMSEEEWQKIIESQETVVEIIKGNGEPPLIILHGAPGTVGPFKTMLKSPTALWAVQMSDDAPTGSLEVLAAFYYQKIKEKQPHGPYRLASYSGSCAILLELALTFESNGDTIAQFIMLDHFPTLFLCHINLDTVDLHDPAWWDPVVKHLFTGVLELFRSAKAIMAAQATVLVDELKDATEGKPVSARTALVVERSTKVIKMTIEFLLGGRFSVEIREGPNAGSKRFSPELFKAYTSGIKSKLAVYVAMEGIRMIMPAENWEDFGAREYFPNAVIREFEGGHLDYLENEELLNSLPIDL